MAADPAAEGFARADALKEQIARDLETDLMDGFISPAPREFPGGRAAGHEK